MCPDEPWNDMSPPYTKKPVQNPESDLFLFTTLYNRKHPCLPHRWEVFFCSFQKKGGILAVFLDWRKSATPFLADWRTSLIYKTAFYQYNYKQRQLT